MVARGSQLLRHVRDTIVNRPLTLGPQARLRKKSDIDKCQRRGTKVYSKHFLMLILTSDVGESRLAVAITTKIDKRAVVRNKIKRRLREIFRSIRHDFIRPIDMVVVARRGAQDCEYEQYKREICGALRSNGYL